MNAKVLITGASGLLGANLVRKMHEAGYKIRILVRKSADIHTILDIPKEVYYGDLIDEQAIDLAIAGVDYVIHAASLTQQWGVQYESYKAINITATQILAQACLKYKVQKLVYVGTANTLAPGSKAIPGTELNAFGLLHINSGYINSKYIALQYIQEQVALQQLPAVIISPTFMLGKYDCKPSSGQLLLHGIKKGILMYPSGGKNFVHVEDVCEAIINALHKGVNGEHYLIAGQNLSYSEFFHLLARRTGLRQWRLRIPGAFLRTAGRMGSLTKRLTNRSVKLDYAGAYMLTLDNYYSGAKAARELSICYRPIETAIEDALNWFKQSGKLPHNI
jgi:dihydroflavonol-4-reductase